jgi:hypothetical protein
MFMKTILFGILLVSVAQAATNPNGRTEKDQSDPRAEIAAKSAIEIVTFAEAMNIGIEDPDIGPTGFTKNDVEEIINTEIAPIFRLIEQERPSLLLEPCAKLLAILKQLPASIQADGRPMAKGVYEGEKKRYLDRFGPKGVGAALAGCFQTKLHNRRNILKTIESSFKMSTVRMRGEDFCNSALMIGMFAAMSNFGAKQSTSDAKAFTVFSIEELLENKIKKPFYALRDATNREVSSESERVENARVVERILDEVAALKNSNKDIEAFFMRERDKAMQVFEGVEHAASAYMATMMETVMEIHSERLNWIVAYPIYAKNGLDWSSLRIQK